MAFSITLSDAEWALVSDLFDPPARRGAPARIERRAMVDAMLFLARTGCQWRYLPERFPPWGAVWQQWRRWRANGLWARAMARLAGLIRFLHGREPLPSMVMIDAQTVKGGRYGPTYHEAGGRGGRTIGPNGPSSSRSWGCPWRPTSSRLDRTTSRPVVSSSTRPCHRSRGCPTSSGTAATGRSSTPP